MTKSIKNIIEMFLSIFSLNLYPKLKIVLPEYWCKKHTYITYMHGYMQKMEDPMNGTRCNHQTWIHLKQEGKTFISRPFITPIYQISINYEYIYGCRGEGGGNKIPLFMEFSKKCKFNSKLCLDSSVYAYILGCHT